MRLVDYRVMRGLTQADVAKRLRVDPKAVSNWECGTNGIARKYHRQLARMYHVEPKDIVAACKATITAKRGEEEGRSWAKRYEEEA